MEWFGVAERQVIAVDTQPGPLMRVPIDPLLAAASRSSNATDVEALFRQHRARLVGLATAITMDRDLAEEVVQEAFLGLQRQSARVEQPIGYLQRSVVNLAISVIRRRRTVARHVPLATPAASTPEIDETWAVVVRLPPRQRAVVVLRFWHDMTVDAIAETLGWPPGSVMSTLHRALKRLEEEIR